MKVVGLITEYNPFHNGHQYHIEMAKQITGAEIVIVVMSGNFVQRGTPAIMSKYLRAESALRAGASLVIELPTYYASGSAEYFALGAVSLLEKLGCVDFLCFGSECGEITVLTQLAQIFLHEPEEYRNALRSYLKLGCSFPLARQKACENYTKNTEISNMLSHPNNVLGIEYLKALNKLHSSIQPFTVRRVESRYHDTELCRNFSSASSIRRILSDRPEDLHTLLASQLPEFCLQQLDKEYGIHYPVNTDDFSLLLKYKLLKETKASLTEYADMSQELACRIYNCRNRFLSFGQFCELLKTKELTYARISRVLLHMILDIKKQPVSLACTSGFHSYVRILGFRKDAAVILHILKEHASIPLITKLSKEYSLPDWGKQMLATDISAADLYESVITDKFRTPFKSEYEHPIVRI